MHAPSAAMRRAFVGETCDETKTSAAIPRAWAAAATPSPWLPFEAVTTPFAAWSGESNAILFDAPRNLNDPVCCRCSSLRNAPREADHSSAVSRTYGAMRSCAARIASIIRDPGLGLLDQCLTPGPALSPHFEQL